MDVMLLCWNHGIFYKGAKKGMDKAHDAHLLNGDCRWQDIRAIK